jgi:hypothetical protein
MGEGLRPSPNNLNPASHTLMTAKTAGAETSAKWEVRAKSYFHT